MTRLSLAAALLALAACAGKPAPILILDFCLNYQPVYTAPEDTQETRDDVNANNAVWLEECAPADDPFFTAP